MQQRYYDPEIGRTLSRDPVTAFSSGDMRHFNGYAYAFNNPYRFTDPDGRSPVDDDPNHRPGPIRASLADSPQTTSSANETTHSDFGNRPAGQIHVTAHSVGVAGPRHLAIEFKGEQGTQVISAGPEDGQLKSGQDGERPTDAPNKNFTVGTVEPPQGVSSKDYFSRLQSADRSYCDCVNYDLVPELGGGGLNSNGYVFGIIQATGGSASIDFRNYVGGSKPVPASYFDASGR